MDITSKNRNELKAFFKINKIPTEEQFAFLIDGMINQQDDRIVKLSSEPLSIEALGDFQKAINFYETFSNPPAWSLQLKGPDSTNTIKAGFCIADGQTNQPRLFIDKATGNIGVGILTPIAKLDIAQVARSGNHSTTIKGLYITGDFSEAAGGIELRNNDGSKGLGLGTTTIYATGNSTNQELQLMPKGSSPLRVMGKANFTDGSSIDGTENKMTSGSLMIGSFNAGFGGNQGYQNNTNIAGLLLQTGSHTEIAVHHHGNRLASLMYYDNSMVTIGRNMGTIGEPYGATPVTVAGDLTALCGMDVGGPGRGTHIESDGAFYRKINESSGQASCYITLNAPLFIRAMGATSGMCSINPLNGTFNNASDLRLKKEIIPMTDMLKKVSSLQGVFFKWKDSPSGENQFGLIAQEVNKVFPELVSAGQEDIMSINYNGFVAVLIEAIKEQQNQIQQLFALVKS